MTQFDLLTYVLIIFWFMFCFLIIYSFFLFILLPHLYQILLIRKFSGLLLWGRISYWELSTSCFFGLLRVFLRGMVGSRASYMVFWWVYFSVLLDLILYSWVDVGLIKLMRSFESIQLVGNFSYSFFRFYVLVFLGAGGVVGVCY